MDRQALADTLRTHARIVAAVIGRRRSPKQLPVLLAIGAAQTMLRLADDVLRELVADARAAGHTWQEIGDVLGTTRQAAYQRFGRGLDEDSGV